MRLPHSSIAGLGLAFLLTSCGTDDRGVDTGGSGGALETDTGGTSSSSGGASTGGTDGSGGASTGGTDGGGGTFEDRGLVDYLGSADFPDAFWEPATFEEVGMSGEPIHAALGVIEASAWEVHSFFVARRGKVVVEYYGWDTGTNPAVPGAPHQVLPTERHPQFSVTKSFLSALYGIALEEGAIGSLDETVASYFPDYLDLNPSANKDLITLEDLLTMRSGLEWTEGEQSTFGAPDPARAMFARPVVDVPVGEVWNYSTGGSDILAEVLSVATGRSPLDYANEKLFGPLGIPDPPWVAGANGTQHGGWGLVLSTREMARFGELYRNRGVWQGREVIPAAWTDESVLPRCPTPWGGQYAYHFWVPDLPGFFHALGAFGQLIYVSRDRELVVVFTANMPSETADFYLRGLIANYIVPAVQ